MTRIANRTLEVYEREGPRLPGADPSTRSRRRDEILTWFLKAGRVLEVGCGVGLEAELLRMAGVQVVATDGSKAMLEEARRLHPDLKGSLQQLVLPSRLPWADGEFGGVLAFDVLMHLAPRDLPGVFSEVARVLKPLGAFYMSILTPREGGAFTDRTGRLFNGMELAVMLTHAEDAGLQIMFSHRPEVPRSPIAPLITEAFFLRTPSG